MIKMARNLLLIKLDTEEIKPSKLVMSKEVKEAINARKAEQASRGVVVAAGPKCEDFKEGDIVRYPGYIGNFVEDEELGEGLFVVVAENDILMGYTK